MEKSELIIYGMPQFLVPGIVRIYLNGDKVGCIRRKRKLVLPIRSVSYLTVKWSIHGLSKGVVIYPGRRTEVQLSVNGSTGVCTLEKLTEDPPFREEEMNSLEFLRLGYRAKTDKCAVCGGSYNSYRRYSKLLDNGYDTGLVIHDDCEKFLQEKENEKPSRFNGLLSFVCTAVAFLLIFAALVVVLAPREEKETKSKEERTREEIFEKIENIYPSEDERETWEVEVIITPLD